MEETTIRPVTSIINNDCIELYTSPNKAYIVPNNLKSKLFRLCKIDKRDIDDMSISELNDLLRYRLRTLKILHDDGIVYRVTSEKYSSIDNEYLVNSIRNALNNVHYDENITYNHGVYGDWILDIQDSDYKHKIWCSNVNDAKHSLRVGSGIVVKVCSNGMNDYIGSSTLKMIHNTHNVNTFSVDKAVKYHISRFHKLTSMIEDSKNKFMSIEDQMNYINDTRYPKHIKEAIIDKIEENSDSKNIYNLSQSISYVGSHHKVTPLYAKQLAELSFKVIDQYELFRN